MSVVEQDIVFTTKDADGNTVIQMPITRAENVENIMSIEQGGTGAGTADEALENLGISGAIVGLSVSGNVITYTKKDGSSGTITTQDTTGSTVSITAGTISSGSTIPLPSGYTRAQCKYAVWPTAFAIYTYATSDAKPTLSVNQSTGVVSFGGNYKDESGGKVTSAAYLCVAVK